MNQQQTLLAGAAFGFLAVALGAFGAHALKPMLTQSGRLETYELAVRYQFYHTIMLFVASVLMMHIQNPKLQYAALFFTLGIFLFSGSLYLLCFTQLKVGMITPVGGLCFLLGYVFLFLGIYQK